MCSSDLKLFKAKVAHLFLTLLNTVVFNIAMMYFFDVDTITNLKSSLFYQILLFNTVSLYIFVQLFKKCNLINPIHRLQYVNLANLFVFLSFQTWKKIYISQQFQIFALLIGVFVTVATLYQIKNILVFKK